VLVQHPKLVAGPKVHSGLLAECLDAALAAFAETASGASAWRRLLRPGEVIGLKFNQSGSRIIATSESVGEVIVRSLLNAGVPAKRIVGIEAPAVLQSRFGIRTARPGYSEKLTDFGSGRDQFAAVLEDISALISVPFLKSHNIAGFTGSLKNLSHGLIKHPARFHGTNCSPYIADIVASAPIRTRLRLCIADGLRVVFDGGPDADLQGISDEGHLVVSTDLVAADAVGLQLVNRVRRDRHMAEIGGGSSGLAYLDAAESNGLGNARPSAIDILNLDG
jgi:hypothetical protein